MWEPEFHRKLVEAAKATKAGHGVSLNEYCFAREITRMRGLALQARLALCDGCDVDQVITFLDNALGMPAAAPAYGEQGDE